MEPIEIMDPDDPDWEPNTPEEMAEIARRMKQAFLAKSNATNSSAAPQSPRHSPTGLLNS